ncbi:MAG: hypothetical protein M0Z92_03525 [Actinomycetota bacterium]|nr:hypothetical protein [Actinomycetota bacterium]
MGYRRYYTHRNPNGGKDVVSVGPFGAWFIDGLWPMIKITLLFFLGFVVVAWPISLRKLVSGWIGWMIAIPVQVIWLFLLGFVVWDATRERRAKLVAQWKVLRPAKVASPPKPAKPWWQATGALNWVTMIAGGVRYLGGLDVQLTNKYATGPSNGLQIKPTGISFHHAFTTHFRIPWPDVKVVLVEAPEEWTSEPLLELAKTLPPAKKGKRAALIVVTRAGQRAIFVVPVVPEKLHDKLAGINVKLAGDAGKRPGARDTAGA